jgi:putative phosphoribosyl transferase
MKIDINKETEIKIALPSSDVQLDGSLYVPQNSRGLILFAHGSGSSRFSPRNRFVAQFLNRGEYATLLYDLLTRSEETFDLINATMRFNIDLLSERLGSVTDFVASLPDFRSCPLGYFGASTGAAAALVAAVGHPQVKAIVSRGGRPDLASSYLSKVKTPTQLIVGGDDYAVIELNKNALENIAAPVKELVLVPGATHLFEEPGALDQVSRLATEWFGRYVH